jgi:PPK2 family polyphosphate:nucleotide phosphotransferase
MAAKSNRKTKQGKGKHRLIAEMLERCRIDPGKKVHLAEHDTAWAGNRSIPKEERKEYAQTLLAEGVAQLAEAQELLYAANTWSVLVIMQAMDAAGKDSTIDHVMSGVNPQGCQVYSFKQPSAEELDHDFLWRCNKALPERGRIGIFNRSYYEEVLVVRVHPEFLAAQRIPNAKAGKALWKQRFEQINDFERHLTENGTTVVKFFLHVSKEEQRQRFLKRIDDPAKRWKFSAADLAERQRWDEYMEAYEKMLSATSTGAAPWYVIPADHKWVTRVLVSRVLVERIRSLDLEYPQISPAAHEKLEAARAQLLADDADTTAS